MTFIPTYQLYYTWEEVYLRNQRGMHENSSFEGLSYSLDMYLWLFPGLRLRLWQCEREYTAPENRS